MSRKTDITLDDIKNFFALAPVDKLDVVGRATGGLGVDNPNHVAKPVIHRHSVTRGTDYVRIEKEKEKLRDQSMLRPPDPPAHGFATVEELSTTIGELPNLNDLTDIQEIHSRFYQTDIKYNEDLPITNYREQILQLISINQVVIIKGSTGCGKTTQVPQYILDHYAKLKKNCNIIVTQPRKIAAVTIAKRVCSEKKWHLGSIVGYKVGLEDKTSPDTRLTYVTTGVLLQQLINERQITRYSHVIVDEVHERDCDTDFVLLILKKLIKTNSPHVKIILMSATIDTSLFANYFMLNTNSDLAPVIEIAGKLKDVQEYYLDDLSCLGIPIPKFDANTPPGIPEDLYDLAVRRLLLVIERVDSAEPRYEDDDEIDLPQRGAVLIFLPGYEEITRMMSKLRAVQISSKYQIFPLHSSITVMEQSQVFHPAPEGYRKIILSTNIAESSITVPDIKYVIDYCLTRNLVCDPETNYTSLRLEWASKSNCIQRKGRAGRVSMGRVYRFVSKAFYKDHIRESGIPEMKRTSLTQLVLHVKRINLSEPLHFLALAIDPPEQCGIEQAVLILKQVGALAMTANGEVSHVDGDLTFVGRIMSRLPLDVKYSKLIILGYVFGYLEDCIIIAACLSLRSFFTKYFYRALDFYKSTLAWANGTYSDCFAYLNAYKMWKEYHARGYFRRPGGQTEVEWGKQNFIQIKRIKEVDLLVQELKKRLEQVSIETYPTRKHSDENHDILMIKIIIAGAFFPNYFTQDYLDEEAMIKEVGSGDVYSTVHITGLPANHGVLYHSAIQEMMSQCGSRMNIEFEERKAYLHFDRKGMEEEFNSSGDKKQLKALPTIHPAVFFAVKMRLLRLPLQLHVFSDADAERRMTQLQNIRRQLEKNCKMLSSNRMIVQHPSYSLKRVDLPSINQLSINIFITHVIDCGHFWARYADQENSNLIIFIESSINAYGGKHLTRIKNVTCGALVLAPYSEGQDKVKYYRASVEEIGEQILVFFIDYGNTKYVNREDLRQMDYEIAPDVLDTPALAFECQLSEVKPAAITSFEWSEASIKWFNNIVRNKTLNAKIYSVVQNMCRLELYYYPVPTTGNLICINTELIRLGFAERAEESLLSQQNFDRRSSYTEISGSFSDADLKPFQLTAQDLMGSEEPRFLSQKISLRGPYSPLEVSYSGITFIDRCKTVKVETDSVNSVSLNREPQDKSSQLLVAASVTLGQNYDHIIVRGTTLMPKVKDLLSLVCLIFSPVVEFRTDPERVAYTGALCGLGFDPITKESFYSDHDIELAFDVAIDYKDICAINGVRMGINMVLSSETDYAEYQRHELMKMQKEIKTTLTELLKRIRPRKEVYHFSRAYQWDQVNYLHVLKAQLEENPGDCQHILPLLDGICLSNVTLEDDLNEHIKMLYKIASKSMVPQPIHCRLCGCTVANPRELLLHLDGDLHKRKEELLRS